MNLLKLSLLLISSLTVMAGATVAPALPMMRDFFQDLPNADFLTRLVITTPALFIALSSPIAGWLLDHYSKKRLILGSMLIYALAGASGMILDNLYLILISRAILGITVSVIMTGATALVGDYLEGKERMEFLGIQGAFMAFGGTIFVSIAGFLAGMSWRFPFAVYLSALLILLLSARVLYDIPKDAPESSSEHAQAAQKDTKIGGLRYLIYTFIFFGMALFYIIPVQSPFLLRSLGASEGLMTSMGLIFGTFFAAVASFFYNRIKPYFHFNTIYAILFMLFGVGLYLVGISNTVFSVTLFTAIACMGIGLLMPNTSLYLLSLSNPANRGRVMGGMTAAVFLGQFCSPLLFQPLIEMSSLGPAHRYAGLFSFGIGGLFILNYFYRQLKTRN